MANEITKLSALQLPTNFASMIAEASTTKSVLFTSGAVAPIPMLNITKGAALPIPFVRPLVAAPQSLSDTVPLETRKLGTGRQVGIPTSRGDAWSVNELAAAYIGEDLLGYIASQLAQYWAEVYDNQVIATLMGAVASEVIPVLNTSALVGDLAKFNTADAIKAQFLLGDARAKLAVIACHSAVSAQIEALNLDGARVADSDGTSVLTYRGMRVVESDKLIDGSGNYTTFMLGLGAFGFAPALDLTEFEVDRDVLGGNDVVVSRASYVLHPMGLSNTLSVSATGVSPTDAQLAADGAWTAAFSAKNIAIVAYVHK